MSAADTERVCVVRQAYQLIRAVSVLLHFTREEEDMLKQTLEYKVVVSLTLIELYSCSCHDLGVDFGFAFTAGQQHNVGLKCN